MDMAIAGAVTDCLQRCFRQLGEQFGNSLYDKEIARTAGIEKSISVGHRSNGNGQSDKSGTHISSPVPTTSRIEELQYRDGVLVDTNNAAEWEAFNTFRSAHHEMQPASREALRAWVSRNNGKK